MNIIYDTQSTINENINLRLNGLRPRSEASEELKNLNGKWIQICMHGFRPFSGSPGLRAGSGAADFLHVRHPIPQSRFASVGECKPRSRPGRVVGESGWGGGVPVCRTCRGRRLARGRAGCWRIRKGGVPVCRKPGARVCLSGSREGSRMPIRVSAGPKAEVRTNAGSAFGRMPGLPGYAWVSHPNRAVGLPERGACCGYGRSAVLARKNEGSPERLPSPSKINP